MRATSAAHRILLALIVVTTAAPALASTGGPWHRYVISRAAPATATMRSLPAVRDGAVARREDRSRYALTAVAGQRSRTSSSSDSKPSSAPDRPRRARSQLRAYARSADDSEPY